LIANLLETLIDVYVMIIMVRVVISWLPVDQDQRWARFIVDVTEPTVGPIRRLLPPLGGLDFSPLVVMLLLELVRNGLAGR
jgi:YggT family protein